MESINWRPTCESSPETLVKARMPHVSDYYHIWTHALDLDQDGCQGGSSWVVLGGCQQGENECAGMPHLSLGDGLIIAHMSIYGNNH